MRQVNCKLASALGKSTPRRRLGEYSNCADGMWPAERGLLILGAPLAVPSELELELIQTHMTQKQLLWVEVGAHAVRKSSGRDVVVRAGVGVAWRLCVLSSKPFGLSGAVSFLCVVCAKHR